MSWKAINFLLAILVPFISLAQDRLPIYPLGDKPGLGFEENKGQVTISGNSVDRNVLFTLKDKGITLYFHKDGISYSWYQPQPELAGPYAVSEATGQPIRQTGYPNESPRAPEFRTHEVQMSWAGASDNVEVIASESTSARRNYYTPEHPEGILGIKEFRKLIYKNIYPNIDVIYYIKNEKLKYDVLLHAGARPADIEIVYTGFSAITLDSGKVKIHNPLGTLLENTPVAWSNGRQIPVAYSLKDNTGSVSFNIDQQKSNGRLLQDVTIDPDVIWSTLYRSPAVAGSTWGYDIALDGAGNVYLGGTAVDAGATCDMYILKLDNTGGEIWSNHYTYPNGQETVAMGVAIDGAGDVYIAGYSYATTNLSTPGSYQVDNAGGIDGVLMKFNASGTRLWGTYYGGLNTDRFTGIAAHGSSIYLSGTTSSSTGIISNAAAPASLSGTSDAFIVSFTTSGAVDWGTYVGGENTEEGNAIITDGSGNVYIAGNTTSFMNITSLNNFQGGIDGFVIKYSPARAKVWGSYFGGINEDVVNDVTVDGANNIYIAGTTLSTSGIVQMIAGHQSISGGGKDAFLIKVNSSTGFGIWGTFYGGIGDDEGYSVAIDNLQTAYLGGSTRSDTGILDNGFPAFSAPVDADGFIARFTAGTGIRLMGSYTYPIPTFDISGTFSEVNLSMKCDAVGNLYIAGNTQVNPSSAGLDAHVMKLNVCIPPTNQATNPVIDQRFDTSVRLTWTRGNGDEVLVVMRELSSAEVKPTSGTNYIANAAFGSGDDIGNNNFVIYKGAGTSVVITGLVELTDYVIDVFEFKTTDNCYQKQDGSYLTIPVTSCVHIDPPANPIDAFYCIGEAKPAIKVTPYANGVMSWYDQLTGGNVVPGDGSQNLGATFIPNAVAGTFYAEIHHNVYMGCVSLSRTAVTLTQYPTIIPGIPGSGQTICIGDNPTVINGGTASGGSGTYTYQWESALFGTGSYTTIPGATQPTYDPPVLNDTTYYRRVVSSSTCTSQTGNFITITTTPPVNATAFSATAGDAQTGLTWTKPASCIDEIMVVAKLGSIVTATPSGNGSAYTANLQFGAGTAIVPLEYVVYKGTGSSATITGLTNGVVYHLKAFTRRGTSWSAGAITTVTGVGTPPVPAFSPLNGATNVSVIASPTITFNEPVRNLDNSAITSANVASLIELKLTNAAGVAVPFAATINGSKDIVTVDPSSSLLPNQLYYLRVLPVEDSNNNPSVATSITFTTELGPSISNFSPTSTCVGQPVTINGNGFGSAMPIVTVNGVNATVTANSNTSITITAPSATTGAIQVTNSTTLISVTSGPSLTLRPPINISLPVVADAVAVLVGGSTNIKVSTSEAGVSYQLKRTSPSAGNVGNPQIGNGATLSFNTGVLSSNGNYVYEVHGSFAGCATGILTAKPTVTVSGLAAVAGTSSSVCAGKSVTLGGTPAAQGGSGDYTISWTSVPVGFTSAIANPAVSPTVTTTYTLKVSDNAFPGLEVTDEVTISVDPLPLSVTVTGAETVCSNQTNLPYQATLLTNTTYTWSGPPGATITGGQGTNAVTVSFGTQGGSVQAIPKTSKGCEGPPSIKTVSVTTRPTMTSAASAALCSGSAPALNFTASVPSTFSWSVTNISGTVGGASVGNNGSGNITNLLTNSQPIAATVTYTVTPTRTDVAGCTGTPQQLVISISAPPSGSGTITGPTEICVGQDVSYTVTGIDNADSYEWSLPNGFDLVGQSGAQADVSVSGGTGGNVSVVGINSCGKGGTSAPFSAQLMTIPELSIIVPEEIYEDIPVSFSYTPSVTFTSILWSFGDGGTSEAEEPEHTYEDIGTFSVALEAWNESGCKADDIIEIQVKAKTTLLSDSDIKNVVTANGDIANAFLYIVGIEQIPDNEVIVLDRWGVEVFRTTNYKNDWDLKKHGEFLPAGNYVCMVKLPETGEVHSRIVTLIRGQ